MQRGSRTVTGRPGPWAVVAGLLGAALLAVVPSLPGQARAFAGQAVTSPADASPSPSSSTTPPDPAPSSATPTEASRSPSSTPSDPAPSSAAPTEASPTPSPTTAPAPAPLPEPQAPPAAVPVSGANVVVDHFVIARLPEPGAVSYQPVDQPEIDAARMQTVRVRFGLHNTGGTAATVSPQLEYRRENTGPYVVVPRKATRNAALHLAREWMPIPGGGGRSVQRPPDEAIAVADLLITRPAGAQVERGDHSMSANPARALTLAAGAATEQEFTVRVSMDAAFGAGYQARVTDAGSPLTGVVATIRVGADPGLQLSAGQRQGVDVAAGIRGAAGRSGLAFPLVATSGVRAALAGSALSGVLGAVPAAGAVTTAIHGPYSMTTDACSVCHRGHTATGPNLLAKPAPTSTLCLSCHDGSGAVDVSAQYTDPSVPADNPTAREYYRHDALAPSNHALAQDNEFGGVNERHADCADCHNAHQAKDTASTEGAGGWAPSGRLSGVSGVAVTNGAAGTEPAYTFLDGIGTPATLEYQLCLKCHSGFTVLPSNTGVVPSRHELDKGVEFNPDNPSYHPVEAAGKNTTAQMTASLSGTSPYKLWDFTVAGTVRCSNCHAGGTPPVTPSGDAPSHTSANRGILLENYRDRVLPSASEPYSAANSALCLVCHAEAPFANETTTATNFKYHGKHVANLQGEGAGGTDIDTPGAGQGNAVCAECHFRLHSTTYQVSPQSVPGTRLVNFAPNVEGKTGTTTGPVWTQTGTGGSCTLTCHGYTHDAENY